MRSIKSMRSRVVRFIKKGIGLFLLLIISSTLLVSQNNETRKQAENYLKTIGEVYFSFTVDNSELLGKLTRIISISNVKGKDVYAYANKKGFEKFQSLSLDYKILKHPGEKGVCMSLGVSEDECEIGNEEKGFKGIWDFDTYPSYTEFVGMMEYFETTYPALCELVDIGNSVLNKDILFIKISDNIGVNEAEPRFMYTSTMHGDETIGYILMLRLINYLLTNYGTDDEITDLVDHTEIWICPLENPDGTYGSGDVISLPTRFNADNVDLNRNYPNPVGGNNPDGYSTQPETQAMMDLFDSYHFVMSANIHAGMELANYPWDSWLSSAKKHADHNWFEDISRDYADTVQANGIIGYFDDMDNGITHGGDWYVVYGSRQDYISYYKNGREITLELCRDKYADLNVTDLPLYWNYNYRSLINYMKEVNYGIQGIVKDSITNNPVFAKVTVLNHDKDSSHVYTELPHGDYYRPVEAGTYTLQFEANGYETKIVPNVIVAESQAAQIDVLLLPGVSSAIDEIDNSLISVFPNPSSNGIFLVKLDNQKVLKYYLFDALGKLVLTNKGMYTNNFVLDLSSLEKGIYYLRMVGEKNYQVEKLVIH